MGIFVLIALRLSRAMLITDRSWTVLLDVTIAKNRSDWMSKPLPAIHLRPMWSWVPAMLSNTGNVTGGRKLARYDFGRRRDAICIKFCGDD